MPSQIDGGEDHLCEMVLAVDKAVIYEYLGLGFPLRRTQGEHKA